MFLGSFNRTSNNCLVILKVLYNATLIYLPGMFFYHIFVLTVHGAAVNRRPQPCEGLLRVY